MASWLRIILSVLALVGLLVSGTGGALAEKGHHHHCSGMMTDDCPRGDGDHGTLPPCCVAPVCALVQLAPPPQAAALAPSDFAFVAAPLRNDDLRADLRAPPALRPPIA